MLNSTHKMFTFYFFYFFFILVFLYVLVDLLQFHMCNNLITTQHIHKLSMFIDYYVREKFSFYQPCNIFFDFDLSLIYIILCRFMYHALRRYP